MQYGEAGVSYVYEFCPYPAPNVDVSQLSVVLTNRKKSSTEGLGRPQVDKGLGRPVKGNNHVVEDQPPDHFDNRREQLEFSGSQVEQCAVKGCYSYEKFIRECVVAAGSRPPLPTGSDQAVRVQPRINVVEVDLNEMGRGGSSRVRDRVREPQMRQR